MTAVLLIEWPVRGLTESKTKPRRPCLKLPWLVRSPRVFAKAAAQKAPGANDVLPLLQVSDDAHRPGVA